MSGAGASPTTTERNDRRQPAAQRGRPSAARGEHLLPEVARTMRLSLIEGGLVQVFLNWTSGSVIIGYLLSLGASPTHIALVGSVPFLAQVASPLGAWAAETLGQRRALSFAIAVASRLLWLLAAFLPQLSIPGSAAPS